VQEERPTSLTYIYWVESISLLTYEKTIVRAYSDVLIQKKTR